MKKVYLLLAVLLLVGCSKESDAPKASNDSLLQKPLDLTKDTVATAKPIPKEWYVDKRRIRTPEHLATMKRFTPTQVRDVYHDFKPLRSADMSSESDEVVKFLATKQITLKELKAILEEGDRLGWATPQK
ncbi:MAG TPA: hypothetical protein VIX80_08125 [Candidatus Kapabacteria bacterium]